MAEAALTNERNRAHEGRRDDPGLILVSEDSALIAYGYRKILNEQGFRVELAADPGLALRAVARERPALASVDLALRDSLDGAELARTLVARGVPVIVATGYAGGSSEAFIQRLGASVVLAKPVGELELLEAVRAVLGVGS